MGLFFLRWGGSGLPGKRSPGPQPRRPQAQMQCYGARCARPRGGAAHDGPPTWATCASVSISCFGSCGSPGTPTAVPTACAT
uniref:ORF_02R n=1 Tax=Human herpesvirus 1 (strain R15) TaxID=36345 RepID=Q6VB63_HHV1R|nr:ORF_02R [Human alphaherpesvirus 1 strain R-15]